jgi:hypothetical protein
MLRRWYTYTPWNLFDNRTSLPIIILNKEWANFKRYFWHRTIHIMVGNHDLYNKGSNDINSVRYSDI